jgi:hypothetical protein
MAKLTIVMTVSIQRKDKRGNQKMKAPARDAFYKKISLVLTEYQTKNCHTLSYSSVLQQHFSEDKTKMNYFKSVET